MDIRDVPLYISNIPSTSQRFHKRRNHCRLAASCTAVAAQTGSRHQKLRRRRTFGYLWTVAVRCWELLGMLGNSWDILWQYMTIYDNIWQYYLLFLEIHCAHYSQHWHATCLHGFHRPDRHSDASNSPKSSCATVWLKLKAPLMIFAHDSHVQTQQADTSSMLVAECHMPTMWNIYIHEYTSYIR